MAGAGWSDKPFNEKNPFGKTDKFGTVAVIGGDNIEFSRQRRAATLAMREGRATPEQAALVRETDAIIAQAIGGQEED